MRLVEIFNNDVLMVSLAAWLTAQLIKAIINIIVNKTFSLERLFGDGGMPSGHSATVTACAIMIGLQEGLSSPIFALALVFAIIVMHDASGIRQEAGKHAKSIIEIVDILYTYVDYCQEKDLQLKTEKLKVFIGHTKLQVFFGIITGIGVVITYLLITNGTLLN